VRSPASWPDLVAKDSDQVGGLHPLAFPAVRRSQVLWPGQDRALI